jgi:signal recognition particle subunit SRP54
MGPMEQVLGMLPQVGPLQGLSKAKVDEGELTKTEAIINSMTEKERNNHQIINGSRRKRIAMGSGTSVQEVNRLLKQYVQAKKMMKTFSSGFMGKKLAKMRLEEMLHPQQ